MRTDTGAANERTALAWQRTALSLVAGAAVMSRLTWADLGLRAAVPLLVCAGLGCWVFWESRTRYRREAGATVRVRARDGRAPAALAAAVLLLGATEIAAVVGAELGC